MSEIKNGGKEIDRPAAPVANESIQASSEEPGEDEQQSDEDKAEAFKQGLRDDATAAAREELPGRDDDSEKTIRETPRMKGL